jgi:hypothetical protein
MNLFRSAAILFLFLLSVTAFAQPSIDPGKPATTAPSYPTTIINGESVPWVNLPSVIVTSPRWNAADRARLARLRYNVLKVLPYAKYARDRYSKLQQDLAVTGDRRQQRKLVKACDQQIKDMFNREVKKMSISQGEILIKLIDRETGYTSYELVKELKGSFSAFFYQSIARVVGHNLKDGYDPQRESEIESIIRSSGYNYYN